MKNLVFILALTAGFVFGFESGNNLYPNPGFTGVVNSRGVWAMPDLWYRGHVVVDGDYKGKNAIKVEAVPVDWGGYDSCVASNHLQLKSGHYLFTVRCRTEIKDGTVLLYFIRHENGKREQTVKKYTADHFSESALWIELVANFEIKENDEKVFFAIGYYGKNPGIVWFAEPKLLINKED